MQEDEVMRENKDRIQNIINLIKLMSFYYYSTIRKILEYRIQLLNDNSNKAELEKKYNMEKDKILEKFKFYKQNLKIFQRELQTQLKLSGRPAPWGNCLEVYSTLKEEQKCFEERGQGIRFNLNPRSQAFMISLYTIKNDQRKPSIFHQKIQKSLVYNFSTLYEKKLKTQYKPQLAKVFEQYKNKYFDWLKGIQDENKIALKYFPKQNVWWAPYVFCQKNQKNQKDPTKFFQIGNN